MKSRICYIAVTAVVLSVVIGMAIRQIESRFETRLRQLRREVFAYEAGRNGKRNA